jgi:hypothetical protein
MTTDINEHLETLCNFAKECDTIVEMGVSHAVSTWAFLEGLRIRKKKLMKDKQYSDCSLLSVDIADVPDIDFVKKEANKLCIPFDFVKISSLDVEIPENTDLLFIDTWHVYGQLKRELEKHHSKVRKYIIMHDTEIDKIKSESVRLESDIDEECNRSGFSQEDVTKGIGYAIVEFVQNHSDEWNVFVHYPYNNGLTVLQRVNE